MRKPTKGSKEKPNSINSNGWVENSVATVGLQIIIAFIFIAYSPIQIQSNFNSVKPFRNCVYSIESFLNFLLALSSKINKTNALLDKVRSCIHGSYDAKQSHLMFNRPLYGHKKVCLEQNISLLAQLHGIRQFHLFSQCFYIRVISTKASNEVCNLKM